MVLSKNQAIYLFELGTTNTGSSAFDLQDLVVLVTLAVDPNDLPASNANGASTTAAYTDTKSTHYVTFTSGATPLGAGNVYQTDRFHGHHHSSSSTVTVATTTSAWYRDQHLTGRRGGRDQHAGL